MTTTALDVDPRVTHAYRVAALMAKLRASPYIPIEPSRKQWLFILDERREVLFGGAAGGAKSWALLAAALLHVDVPGYHALLLRRSYADLILPGALMDVAGEWLAGTDATPVAGGRSWEFPSGATITFSYLGSEGHKYRYQSAAFSFVGFDELSQFTSSQYRYLFSRVRQPLAGPLADVPLRVRAATNPGAVWVKKRFIDPHSVPTRVFIQSLMEDNPHLDRVAYREMLAELDPVERRQLEHGDWDVRAAGNFFKATTFRYVPREVLDSRIPVLRVRAWDLAATEDAGDWAAGVLVAFDKRDGRWRVEDVVRVQEGPDDLERTLQATAARDGRMVPIGIEQEPGSAGKLAMRDIRRRILAGHTVRPLQPTGSKSERARLAASLIANGDMDLVEGPWNAAFADELVGFPTGEHDDQVDGLAHATHMLSSMLGGPTRGASGTRSEVEQKPKTLPQTRRTIQR